MNRRVFMAGTAASAGMFAAPRIRIGFIGASHSHASGKIAFVKSSPDWELVGVSEENAKIAERYRSAGIPLLSRDQILKDSTIPVVAVESDVKDHLSHGMMAVEAGKHVHVEKPPADTLDGFKKMAAVAARKRLLLQCGYMWRYNPGVVAASEAARKGWLGDVYFVRGVMNTLIAGDRRLDWGQFRGGNMFELGSHLIDFVVRLLGRPTKVTPFLRHDGPFDDTFKDNTLAVLEYPRTLAVVQTSALQPGAFAHRTMEIQGTNGTAVLRPIEPPTLQIDLAKAAGPYNAGKQSVELRPYKRYEDDFTELAAAVRGEKKLSASLEEELLVQEIVMLACGM